MNMKRLVIILAIVLPAFVISTTSCGPSRTDLEWEGVMKGYWKPLNEDTGELCTSIPYFHFGDNANGSSKCKVKGTTTTPGPNDDVGEINQYSYLRHEFEQAKKKGKTIVIVYNSLYKQPGWLPWYMSGYADVAQPFWKYDVTGKKVGNYAFIKKALGYE